MFTPISLRYELFAFSIAENTGIRFPGSENIVGGAELIFDLIKENETKARW
jgi:hypothetical protein